MPRRSQARQFAARSGARAAWHPARFLPRGRGARDREGARGATTCARTDDGRGVRPGPRLSRMRRTDPSHAVQLAEFDGAAIFDLRMIERALDGLIVIRSFNQVVTGQHFLGFAVRSIGNVWLAVPGADDAADVDAQALTVLGERLLGPGH